MLHTIIYTLRFEILELIFYFLLARWRTFGRRRIGRKFFFYLLGTFAHILRVRFEFSKFAFNSFLLGFGDRRSLRFVFGNEIKNNYKDNYDEKRKNQNQIFLRRHKAIIQWNKALGNKEGLWIKQWSCGNRSLVLYSIRIKSCRTGLFLLKK